MRIVCFVAHSAEAIYSTDKGIQAFGKNFIDVLAP
jgi:hypothetical protein